MEEYDKAKHGSYREYQKIKIKESSDKIQADKQKKYDKKAKAKSIAADKNKKAKKGIERTKELKKNKSLSIENKKTLNKVKKIYKQSKTTKRKELNSIRYEEAKEIYNRNLEKGTLIDLQNQGVDTPVDGSGSSTIMDVYSLSQTPITFKNTFASKNPITKMYSK
jgi:hypothetical protein